MHSACTAACTSQALAIKLHPVLYARRCGRHSQAKCTDAPKSARALHPSAMAADQPHTHASACSAGPLALPRRFRAALKAKTARRRKLALQPPKPSFPCFLLTPDAIPEAARRAQRTRRCRASTLRSIQRARLRGRRNDAQRARCVRAAVVYGIWYMGWQPVIRRGRTSHGASRGPPPPPHPPTPAQRPAAAMHRLLEQHVGLAGALASLLALHTHTGQYGQVSEGRVNHCGVQLYHRRGHTRHISCTGQRQRGAGCASSLAER